MRYLFPIPLSLFLLFFQTDALSDTSPSKVIQESFCLKHYLRLLLGVSGYLPRIYPEFRASHMVGINPPGRLRMGDKEYLIVGNLDPNNVGREGKLFLVRNADQSEVIKDFGLDDYPLHDETFLTNLMGVVDGHYKTAKFLEEKNWGPRVFERKDLLLRMEFIEGYTLAELKKLSQEGSPEFTEKHVLKIHLSRFSSVDKPLDAPLEGEARILTFRGILPS